MIPARRLLRLGSVLGSGACWTRRGVLVHSHGFQRDRPISCGSLAKRPDHSILGFAPPGLLLLCRQGDMSSAYARTPSAPSGIPFFISERWPQEPLLRRVLGNLPVLQLPFPLSYASLSSCGMVSLCQIGASSTTTEYLEVSGGAMAVAGGLG